MTSAFIALRHLLCTTAPFEIKKEMQSLQRVSCRQRVQFLERNTLSLGHQRPTSSPVSETRKRQHINASTIRFAARLFFPQFSLSLSCDQHNACVKFLVLDPGTPDSLDVRSIVVPSQPSCPPNMPKPFSESVGSFCASEPFVPSESRSKLSSVSAGSSAPDSFQEEQELCTFLPGGARALFDMHDRVTVSSVGGTRAHSNVCERPAVSFGFGGARVQVVATSFSAEVSASRWVAGTM